MKNKSKKTVALIIVYVILVVAQLFLCVPYNAIVVSLTKQNVLYSEVVGSGYSTLSDIQYDRANFIRDDYDYGKKVNTPQLAVNLTITTIVVSAMYFLFIFKKETKEQDTCKQQSIELPYIDFNDLAFADEETQRKVQQDYAEAMYRFVKNKIDRE